VALAVNREQDWPARPASLWINVAGCPLGRAVCADSAAGRAGLPWRRLRKPPGGVAGDRSAGSAD
jgi:hypothetical protein